MVGVDAAGFLDQDDKANRDLALALESLQSLIGLLFFAAAPKILFFGGFSKVGTAVPCRP